MRTHQLYLIMAALTIAGCGQREVVTVAGDRSFEPYEYCTPYSNYASGILVEIWRRMAEQNDVRIRYLCYSWSDAQAAVRAGRVDAVGGMVRSARRERSFRFVRRLVRNPPEYFYFDTDDYPTEPNFAELVKDKTPIGVVKDDFAEEKLTEMFPGIVLKTYESYGDVVKAANENEIDVFTMEESVASTHLDKLGITQRFTRSARPFFHEWLWAAVQKDNISLAGKLTRYFTKVSDEDMARVEHAWRTSRIPPGLFTVAMQWLDDHPTSTLMAEILAPYYGVVILLYIFWPYAFYRISTILRSIDIPLRLGPIDKIPLRYLLLAFLPDTSRRIIDALLTASRETLSARFGARRTVHERQAVYMIPLFVAGDRVEPSRGVRIDASGDQLREQQLVEVLKNVFYRPAACLVISGDGGSGKTSLACWIASHDLDPRKSRAIFPNLTAPVLLEGKLPEQPLIDTIHGQLNDLMDDDIHEDVSTAMLKHGRVLVIVDGFSEMSSASREKFAGLDPKVPRFHTVFTSRAAEAVFGGIAVTEIRPEKLTGPALAGLLDFYLRKSNVRSDLSEPRYFSSLEELTAITQGPLLTPLLVAMYASLLESVVKNSADSIGRLTGVAELFFRYVNALNSRLALEDRKSESEVQVSLQRCAWVCVSEVYRPQSMSRTAVMVALDSDETRASAMLEYLEKKLGLIDMQSAPTLVRIVLDPLAEYFAASQLCNEFIKDEAQWNRFLSFVTERDQFEHAVGFVEAVLNTINSQQLGLMPEQLRKQAIECLGAANAVLKGMGRFSRFSADVHK